MVYCKQDLYPPCCCWIQNVCTEVSWQIPECLCLLAIFSFLSSTLPPCLQTLNIFDGTHSDPGRVVTSRISFLVSSLQRTPAHQQGTYPYTAMIDDDYYSCYSNTHSYIQVFGTVTASVIGWFYPWNPARHKCDLLHGVAMVQATGSILTHAILLNINCDLLHYIHYF